MNFYHNLHLPRRLAAFLVCLLLAGGVLIGLMATATVQAQEVEPSEHQRAAINELLAEDLAQATAPVSFLVVLHDQPDAHAAPVPSLQAASAHDRRAALYATLTAHAERTPGSFTPGLTPAACATCRITWST